MRMLVAFASAAVAALALVSLAIPSEAATRQKQRSPTAPAESAVQAPDFDTYSRGYGAYGYEPSFNFWSDQGCTRSPGMQSYTPCIDH